MGESRGKSSGPVPGALTDMGVVRPGHGSPADGVSGTGGEGMAPGWMARVDPVAGAGSPVPVRALRA